MGEIESNRARKLDSWSSPRFFPGFIWRPWHAKMLWICMVIPWVGGAVARFPPPLMWFYESALSELLIISVYLSIVAIYRAITAIYVELLNNNTIKISKNIDDDADDVGSYCKIDLHCDESSMNKDNVVSGWQWDQLYIHRLR